MKKSITHRIPLWKSVHLNIRQDEMFHRMMSHLISNKVVLHNKEYDFDYVIEEVRTSEDLIKCETIIEFDIDIVKGEYNEEYTMYQLNLLENSLGKLLPTKPEEIVGRKSDVR